jgi:hypothetical protein
LGKFEEVGERLRMFRDVWGSLRKLGKDEGCLGKFREVWGSLGKIKDV